MPSRAEQLQQLYIWGLCLVAFVIPFPFIFGSISVIILAVLWLFRGDLSHTLKRLKTRKILWFWIAFFLLHLISYSYSEDKYQSAFDTESKLSFLVLPVIAGTAAGIGTKELSRVLSAFISGITLSAAICLIHSSIVYLEQGTTEQFFYHELVRGFEANAVYFAWYVFFSLSALLLFPWQQNDWYRQRPVFLMTLILQSCFFILLSSRTLLVLFLLFVIPVVLARASRQLSRTQKLLVLSLPLLLLILAIFTQNPVRKRFEDILVKKPAAEVPQKGSYMHFNNLTLRGIIWETAWNNIREKDLWLTGCGNGDVALLQKERMARDARISPYDFRDATIWKFNIHNMYLQSLYMLGIPGAVIFLVIMIVPFFMIRRLPHKAFFYAFHISACIFMVQESALQTQAGIIYFTFFSMLLTGSYYTSVKTTTFRDKNLD